MKKVYVDTSAKTSIVTIVIDNEVLWDTIFEYGIKRDTEEAEIMGIVLALKKSKDDVIIINDNQSLIQKLRDPNSSNITEKIKTHYLQIKELSKNRTVEFHFENRWLNKTGLKQDGYSFCEINNPKLLEQSILLDKELKRRDKEANRIVRKNKKIKLKENKKND